MYMYYFSQPEFFLLLLLLRAFSRIQTQHTYRAASLALPACCAQLLLPSPSSLHTMLCCAVITAFALCYIFSLRFVHFALHSHSRTHVHVRIHRYTHTQAQTRECVRKSDDWKAASASSTALRLRAHSGFIIFLFFRQFAFVCFLRADAFRCWAPKKIRKTTLWNKYIKIITINSKKQVSDLWNRKERLRVKT